MPQLLFALGGRGGGPPQPWPLPMALVVATVFSLFALYFLLHVLFPDPGRPIRWGKGGQGPPVTRVGLVCCVVYFLAWSGFALGKTLANDWAVSLFYVLVPSFLVIPLVDSFVRGKGDAVPDTSSGPNVQRHPSEIASRGLVLFAAVVAMLIGLVLGFVGLRNNEPSVGVLGGLFLVLGGWGLGWWLWNLVRAVRDHRSVNWPVRRDGEED